MIYKVVDGKAREITDIKYVEPDGHVRQITARYYIEPETRTARLVWEWMTGFIFTKNGNAIVTKSGSVVKCKNQ